MIQNIIVFIIVTMAVIFMVRKIYLQIKGKGGCDCGCCSKCSLHQKQTKLYTEKKQKEGNSCSCCKKD